MYVGEHTQRVILNQLIYMAPRNEFSTWATKWLTLIEPSEEKTFLVEHNAVNLLFKFKNRNLRITRFAYFHMQRRNN